MKPFQSCCRPSPVTQVSSRLLDALNRANGGHSPGVVLSLRWSNSGAYLASGSDDKIVMIWSLEQ